MLGEEGNGHAVAQQLALTLAQQKRLLVASGIKGLIFDPFGPVLDLTYTTKE